MRYIQLYEDKFKDAFKKINKKLIDYQLSINKYIIFERKNYIYLGKLKNILSDSYFVDIETYEYDHLEKGYNVLQQRLHIISFNILGSYDEFKDAKNAYEIMLDSNKYNL